MGLEWIVAGITSLLLLIYLMTAMLFPERF